MADLRRLEPKWEQLPMKLRGDALAVLAWFAVLVTPASAQDTNYWSRQYGAQSELLGGAVVGSSIDISATYYNPGGFGLLENPAAMLSAEAFEILSLKMENVAGGDISSTNLSTAPTLFATVLPRWTPGRLAVSALTRLDLKLRLSVRGDDVEELFTHPPETEDFFGEFFGDQDIGENWFGLTWAGESRKGIGLGLTQYVVYRGHRARSQLQGQGAPPSGEEASLYLLDDYSYRHFRLVTKLGAAFRRGAARFGVTVTTPGIAVIGTGSAGFFRGIVNLDVDGDGAPDSRSAQDFQEDLDVTYRSPWAIALGASYRWPKTAIHVSTEWYDAVDRYDVLDPSDFQDTLTGETLRRRLSHELQSVWNFGIGIEQKLRRTTAYASFSTDASAAVPGTETNHSLSNWDISHVGAGLAAEVEGLKFTLGLTYSFGRNQASVPPADASRPEIPIEILDRPEVSYGRLKMLLGFEFNI